MCANTARVELNEPYAGATMPYLLGIGSCLLWLGDAMQVVGLTLTPKPPRRHFSPVQVKIPHDLQGALRHNHMCYNLNTHTMYSDIVKYE